MLNKIIGIKKITAKKNLKRVREIGLIIPDNFADAINEPDTKKVARSTKKWAFNI